MTRFLAIATLLFAAAAVASVHAGAAKAKEKDKDFEFKGTFTKDDPKDAIRNGPSQVHAVKMKAGTRYTIDLMATDKFDAYLRLLDPKGKQLEEDDDGGDGLNSRIIFNCTTDGDYKVVATTFGADTYGRYHLTVKASGGVPKPSSGHIQMIGKAAPDFKSDFAVNGAPGKLSDLKGKVVLLYFFEVRAGTSPELFKKLAELNTAHKDAGLRIVGTTFYTSDIGQKLAFDKETGGVKTVKKADRASDQAMLKAFAEHHKIGFPVLALPKQDALDAFDAYVINGLPQLVVIDRQGMVRLVELRGEKGIESVQSEIKKLLAEK